MKAAYIYRQYSACDAKVGEVFYIDGCMFKVEEHTNNLSVKARCLYAVEGRDFVAGVRYEFDGSKAVMINDGIAGRM